MEAEIVACVMDVTRQAAEPAAAEPGPDQHADGGYQQAYDYQEFSEVVHDPTYITIKQSNRLAKRFHRFVQRLAAFQS